MNPFSTKSRALPWILAILQAFALASCGGGGSDGAAIPALLTSLSPGSTTRPGPTLDSSVVTVSWNAASGATYYKGGIAEVATNFGGAAINTSGTSTSITLSPGKQYYWYVDACNSSGCSMINAPYYFQTPAAAPTCTPPQVLTNGVCVTPPPTPTCTLPQVLTNGVCVTPPVCTPPQTLVNGQCVTTTPPSDNSDCSTFYVRGRVLTIDITMSIPGIPTRTTTVVRSFGADTTFLGQAVEQVIDQDVTNTPAVTSSMYIQDLSTEWIELGFTSTWSGGSSTGTYQPAIHSPKQWAIGQTAIYSGQLILPVEIGNATLLTTTTFVRRESVMVPAGTFNACLFHTDSTSSNIVGTAQSSSDTWIAPNVGEVKMVNTSGTSTNTHVLRQVQ